MSMDFIGFTYNGKHSSRDLGIYRTSNGSRYIENLTPTLTDKTTDAAGRDGQYYFYTTAKNQTFSVSYVFDSLTESGLRKLKQVFNGREIHDLIFDEAPYKTWSAKVTGNSQVKHLCFTDANGDRVYRGEGTLTFTCYWPYARTSDISGYPNNFTKANIPSNKAVECNLFTQAGEAYKLTNSNSRPGITIYYAELVDGVWGAEQRVAISPGASKVFDNPAWIKRIKPTAAWGAEQCITIADDEFYYTTNGTFEYFGDNLDGRNINHYSPSLFTNKREWAPECGLFSTPKNGENYGDLPANFVFTKTQVAANTTILIGGIGEITILEECNNLEWDSRTGLVTGEIDESRRPVAYSGNSLIEIPVGENAISVSDDETLTYNYWYY